jgi:hypothetical protein
LLLWKLSCTLCVTQCDYPDSRSLPNWWG